MPNFWLFQTHSRDFDLAADLQSRQVGDEAEWAVVDAFAAEVQPGEPVLLYQMGQDKGIYAVGEIASPAQDRSPADADASPAMVRPDAKVVQVRYTDVLRSPVPRERIEERFGRSLELVRSADKINYKLSPTEWNALMELAGGTSTATLPERLWWVNEGTSYELPEDKDFLWCPQTTANGRRFASWEAMTRLKTGDLVLHYVDQEVLAMSRVTTPAAASNYPRPDAEVEDIPGWLVHVHGEELDEPIALEEIPEEWRTQPMKGGPFNHRGGVNQGYVFSLSEEFSRNFFARFTNRLPDDVMINKPRQILKVAPGLGARYWEECLAGDFMCVGWAEVGDLRDYDSEEALRTAILSKGATSHAGAATQLARNLWAFRNLKLGDVIVANRGRSHVLALGEVVEPGYDYRPDRPYYPNLVHVKWDTSVEKDIPDQGTRWGNTIWPLHEKDLARILDQTPPTGNSAFESIVQSLASQGLSFSDELISNYLLALQAKRFTILTGISGTGKTQLAMAVARHFQPVIELTRPKVVPADALEIEVKPYMLKYNRVILPVALMSHIELPPPDEGGAISMNVHFAGDQLPLRVSSTGTGNNKELLFKGTFRKWFAATFEVGDRLLLRPRNEGENSVDELEVLVPEVSVRREALPNYRVIAVRPDWTDNRGLLGYYNPITESYTTTELLRLLLDAHTDQVRAEEEGREPFPFFAILDEMNLARVEHYFSDFLSALESGEEIELHHNPLIEAGETEDTTAVPRRLRVPSNVFFTGTVNVDETTFMFSPKVLDRAFTIEFNDVDLSSFGVLPAGGTANGTGLRAGRLPATIKQLGKPDLADWQAFGKLEGGDLRETVVELNDLLTDESRHFGYRVANEIARFVRLAAEQTDGSGDSLWAAFDLAVLQKVLPKFHGTQQELEEPLRNLFAFAVQGSAADSGADLTKIEAAWRLRRGQLESVEDTGSDDELPRLPRTAAKVRRMLERVRRQGFTAYVE